MKWQIIECGSMQYIREYMRNSARLKNKSGYNRHTKVFWTCHDVLSKRYKSVKCIEEINTSRLLYY